MSQTVWESGLFFVRYFISSIRKFPYSLEYGNVLFSSYILYL